MSLGDEELPENRGATLVPGAIEEGEDLDADFNDEFRRGDCVEIEMSDDDIPPSDEEDDVPIEEDENGEVGVVREEYDDDDEFAGTDDAIAFVSHREPVCAVALSPVDRSIVATGSQDDTAVLWALSEEAGGVQMVQRSRLEGHTDTVSQVAFSNDGLYVATGSYDNSVKVWTVSTGQLLHTLEGPAKEVEWIMWHPKGHAIVAGSGDTLVWMWWAPTGKLMQCFAGHASSVTCGCWALGGKVIVTGSEDCGVIAWDPRAGTPKQHFRQLHTAGLICICAHDELPLVACGSEDSSAKVVHIETGKVIATLTGHSDSIEAIGFSATTTNGLQLLATGSMDGKVLVWDGKTFDLRCTLNEHFERGGLVRIKWLPPSPLGLWLCTCATDNTVRLFDALAGRCLRTLYGHSDSVLDIDITLARPDAGGAAGQHQLVVVSGSDDTSCRTFVVPLEQVASAAAASA